MALPTDIRQAVKTVEKPFELYVVFIWFDETEDHDGFYALTPSKEKGRQEKDLTLQQKMAGNQYLFKLKEVVESFDVRAQVWGYDKIKG